jgi:maltose alpha-D-glucosyltransferase/alpha-amylase
MGESVAAVRSDSEGAQVAGKDWLRDGVIYQIFLPSFADGNGDGIGDLAGAVAHLDHLEWLGVDVIWFNPCFVSPFRDAGYDVADYVTIAPRYGTNEEMVALVAEAGRRGIRVLLDLVAGHTSVEHPWFRASAADPRDDRYIWSDRPGPGFVPSPGPRSGYYLKNFFDEQPALNFGFARAHEAEPWRQDVGAPGPQANRAALRQVMAYWLERGVAGFRVDMAYSLVKDDPDFTATAALWAELRGWIEDRFPDAALLPENDHRVTPAWAYAPASTPTSSW